MTTSTSQHSEWLTSTNIHVTSQTVHLPVYEANLFLSVACNAFDVLRFLGDLWSFRVSSSSQSQLLFLIYPTVLYLCSIIPDCQPLLIFMLSFVYYCLSLLCHDPSWVFCSVFEEQCSGHVCECLSNPLLRVTGHAFVLTSNEAPHGHICTHRHTHNCPRKKIFHILKPSYVLTEHVLGHAPSNLLTLSHWKPPPTQTHRQGVTPTKSGEYREPNTLWSFKLY